MITVWRVALFSAVRQIRRASLWTTLLTIFIMALTFLNMVVLWGILVGLIQGASNAVRSHYTGDVIISAAPEKSYIEETQALLAFSRGLNEIEAISVRYGEAGEVEANYKGKSDPSLLPDKAGAFIVGINPSAEDQVTGLSTLVAEGSYLTQGDEGKILIGSNLLERYSSGGPQGEVTVGDVYPGTKVRITVNGFTKEVEVKGILNAKVQQVDGRIFFLDSELRKMIGRTDLNADEIAMKLRPNADEYGVANALLQSNAIRDAVVEPWEDAQGEFIAEIRETFSILGTALGSLAVAVAAITIFIVIFINALNRKRYIGIQKAIGIHPTAIVLSYVLQAVFYACIGIGLSALFVFLYLEPYFMRNPIDFPFSNGILYVTESGTMIRAAILLATTFIAGYLPARSIVSGNTLDAMLGR